MPMHDWTRVYAGVYHDFHQTWLPELKKALNGGILPEGYYSLVEQSADGPVPDVLTLEASKPPAEMAEATFSANAAVALAEHPPRVKFTEQEEEAIYARKADRVAVYQRSGDRVVAYIEIVSSGNKHSQFAFDKFLDKLDDALACGIHLLVVDPYPPGRRDPHGIHAAFWERRMGTAHGVTEEQPLGLSAYRSDVSPTAYFEPIAVGKVLPDMPLFLTPDHYVNCPLESTYMAAWDGVPPRWKTVIEAEGERGT